MKNLLLEQRGPQGQLKTWRLRAEGRALTFGSSKHADLRSPDTSVRGIHGYFEYQEGQWKFVSLNLNHENQNDPIVISLTESTELKIGSTIVTAKPFDDRKNIVNSLEQFSM